MTAPRNADEIKALGERLGRPARTLFALSADNDPFYIGKRDGVRLAEAKWFAALFKKFKFGDGVHLRRIHYRLVSQRTPVKMRDGSDYENTVKCWKDLVNASKDARYLDLVSADDFIDRRVDEPIVNGGYTAVPVAYITDGDDITIPQEMPDLPVAQLSVGRMTQRYQIEIWAEKSTMSDVLEPLAERYGVTLVQGAGDISITHCNRCVRRSEEDGRPVRILYISDFDPGGLSMPVAAARKIEWFIREGEHDVDVQLHPIVLTPEQCEQYNLPRTPIKETAHGIERFERRFGEGATELDALEALHPGVLEQIVEQEILRYYDPTLDARTLKAARPIQAELSTLTGDVHRRHAKEIGSLRAEYAKIVAAHARWMERAEVSFQGMHDILEAESKDILDAVEWPEPRDADEYHDPLYDSGRDYVEQIDRYKAHQDKPTARKVRSDQGRRRSETEDERDEAAS
jgi:hypothetical protein